MTNKIIIGVIILLVLVGGGYLLSNKGSSSTPSATQSTSDTQAATATITYSDSGFSPSSTTVSAGDTIAIKNTSQSDLQLESDPHPAHTDDSDLNVGTVAPGKSKTFTVTKKGTFGFHNHLNSSDTGKITVQ